MSGRAIHLAQMDKVRPVLILTPDAKRPSMSNVTVAVITTTMRGLNTEVNLTTTNGVQYPCVVSLDNVQTIPKTRLKRKLGELHPDQEPALSEALHAAFALK